MKSPLVEDSFSLEEQNIKQPPDYRFTSHSVSAQMREHVMESGTFT